MARVLLILCTVVAFGCQDKADERRGDRDQPDQVQVQKELPLGFDVIQIPPQDPKKAPAVARVLNEYFYGDDFTRPATEIGNGQQGKDDGATGVQPARDQPSAKTIGTMLQSVILSKLTDSFAREEGITATPEEINQWKTRFDAIDPLPSSIAKIRRELEEQADELTAEDKRVYAENIQELENILEQQKKDDREMSDIVRAEFDSMKGRMAQSQIIGWKVDRALYQKYGGTVIFQQSNPMEPVGAYREFLHEMEDARVFEIFDEETRKEFWAYFDRDDHPFKVDKEDVNFDHPWWMEIAQNP